MWSKSGASAAAAFCAVLIALGSSAFGAAAAVITTVSAERRGDVVEIHFKLIGAPKLRLTGRGNQLTIDLGRTRLEIPPRPLFGNEPAPLASLRAIENPGGDSELIIEVSGKTDYALAQPPGEILIRLAARGKGWQPRCAAERGAPAGGCARTLRRSAPGRESRRTCRHRGQRGHSQRRHPRLRA